MWRGLVTTPGNIDDGDNFDVPIMKWITFGEWSRLMGAMLGDDAQVVGKPTKPLDNATTRKVSDYMTWRFFEYMKSTPALAAWTFRTILFGRAHAYCPYEREYYWERHPARDVMRPSTKQTPNPYNLGELEKAGLRWQNNGDGTYDIEQVSYDGPKLISLWPSELILPAQVGVQNVNEFDWKIRRLRVTPQQLLDGEEHGVYQGISENWEEIISNAQQRLERDYWWDYEQVDADQAEGISHATLMGNRDSVELWQWYGKWRLPKNKRDSRPENIRDREKTQADLLIKFLPKSQLVVGVQDLRTLYPMSAKRDPFLDMGLVKDGSYWCPGFGEILEDIQNKSTANYALFERAGKLSVGPVILFKPSGGFDPETFVYEPGMAVPTEDPTSVRIVEFKADTRFSQENQQALQGFAEKTTGISDQTNGVSIDRPNAPRTLGGQQLLQEQGNLRGQLDLTMLRDDMSLCLEHIWLLDREFSDAETFFRVTGEDADNVYETQDGFGSLNANERMHNFDFQLKFATSVYSREAEKNEMVALYNMSMQNPLVQQNPKALWELLNRLWKTAGKPGFSDIIPAPPELDNPRRPVDEWSLMLKGDQDVMVNPLDNDDAHIMDHRRRLAREVAGPVESRHPAVEKQMAEHILDHEHQKMQKMRLQALAQKIQAQLAAEQQTLGAGPSGPLNPLQPQPGAPPPGPEAPPSGPGPGPVKPLGIT